MTIKIDFGFWIIASPATLTVWDLYPTKEAAEQALSGVRVRCLQDARMCAAHHIRYPNDEAYWLKQAGSHLVKYDDYQVMTFDDYAKVEADKVLSRPIEEISHEQYLEALNVLPPLKWGTNRGVKSFFMSEFWSGNYTQQYAHMRGRYFSKLVDFRKPETWIQPKMVKETPA